MLEIVPLTQDHLVELYGPDGRIPTVKGVAGLLDGEVIGAGGFAIAAGKVIAFCEIRDAAREFKTAIHRSAIRLMLEARERHRMIMAECDPKEVGAPKWLSRLGFEEISKGAWVWRA